MLKLSRNPAIDALRTLAVLGMMAAHTSRLIVFESRTEWSYWVLLLEPLIPSLFLFLVGISLTYSFSKTENKREWYIRQARRALGLWLISALFFALEEGVRLPDVFLASGILCTIAYSILLLGALLLFPRPTWILAGLLILGCSVFVWMDQTAMHAFPWIMGNSPLFPLCLFTIAGALWGLTVRRFPRMLFGVGFPAMICAICIIAHYGWEPMFTIPLGRSDASRILAPAIMGGPAKMVGYYNLRPLFSLICLGVHLGILGLASLSFSQLSEKPRQILFALGRHSLGAYILHLSLLAILVVSIGLHPLKTSGQGILVLILVALICWVSSYLKESHFFSRKPNFSP